MERCSLCDGKGWYTCPWCKGTREDLREGGLAFCPRCVGTGKHTCEKCGGSGKVEDNKKPYPFLYR